uniref:ATP synthase complex subunit 8 n=1 Tax=Nerita versicolor TaxID=159942 RepID=A0A075D0J5_NERVS|nr:ATP synthase F0 subunit 8 [Nerita versicolor]
MPQLAPLNWILLFFLFWACLFIVMSINWWFSLTRYSGLSDEELKEGSKKNSWVW